LRRLLRNSPAQRSLARPDSPEFLPIPGAEPALRGLLRNSPHHLMEYICTENEKDAKHLDKILDQFNQQKKTGTP
jgi:hypothetical protein